MTSKGRRGARGLRGQRGATGARGVAGPAGRPATKADMLAVVQDQFGRHRQELRTALKQLRREVRVELLKHVTGHLKEAQRQLRETQGMVKVALGRLETKRNGNDYR